MRPSAWAVALTALCLAYAAVRYVVAGGAPPDRLPAWVANKGLSLAGLVLLAAAAAPRPAAWRRGAFLAGVWLVGVHVLLSLGLHGPAYYPKLYAPGPGADRVLTVWGEWALVLGAAGFAALLLATGQARSSRASPGAAPPRRRAAPATVLALAGLHTAAIGWAGWLTPGTWAAGLPPITLLSTVAAAVGVVLSLMPARE